MPIDLTVEVGLLRKRLTEFADLIEADQPFNPVVAARVLRAAVTVLERAENPAPERNQ